MLWKADSRQGTSFRLRIHVLVKRLEEIMKTYEAAEKKAIEEEAAPHA